MSFLFARPIYYPTATASASPCATYNKRQSCGPTPNNSYSGPANLWSLIEDTLNEAHRSARQAQAQKQHQRPFNPRFDVRELETKFVLEGEVAGVAQSDLSVSFLDEKTLRISGHRGQAQDKGKEPVVTALDVPAEEEETQSKKSYQPTIEDDTATVAGSGDADWIDIPTSQDEHAKPAPKAPTSTPAKAEAEEAMQPAPQSRAWIAERGHGAFERTFEFQTRVDREGVSASLRDGVLRVEVPKARKLEVREVRVE